MRTSCRRRFARASEPGRPSCTDSRTGPAGGLRCVLDGREVPSDGLAEQLPDGVTRALLRVDPSLSFVAVQPLLVQLANAGVTPLLEAPAAGGP